MELALPASTHAHVAVRCFHCGEPAGDGPRIAFDGAPRAFCCEGCAAAAAWIADAQLSDYYRLRSASATRVAPPADLDVWDHDDLLAAHAREVEGGREITLVADGMRCAACAWLIDRALSREAGVLEAGANAVTGRVRIRWDPSRTRLSRVVGRLASLGYAPSLAAGEAREAARRAERNRWLLRLGVAGLGAMQAMMFAEALYLDTAGEMSTATRDVMRWLAFFVSTPVVFYAGWPFLAGAARELSQRRAGMDTLVAASTLLAYGASLVETLRGGPHVWFDAAVMFVFLLLLARMLESRARSVAGAQVDALARAQPQLAVREREDGTRESVPAARLATSDTVHVAAGQAVPADGVLLDGAAAFEEALLTGEAHPVERKPGDAVYAGTTCRERAARLRVTAAGSATRLSQLASLVERAQAHRPRVARIADRVAGVFVLVLALLALATWIGWRLHAPERAFEVTLALLVISCPCALSLAVPAVQAAAHGALARIGVLALRPDALERLAQAGDIVFDKTGTLGDGAPRLVEAYALGDFDLARAHAIAAALERDSGHPLAAAFVAGDASAVRAHDVVAVPGDGVRGQVDGVEWRLGRAPFACGGIDDGALWLGDGTRAVARFRVEEAPREGAGAAIGQLRALGMDVHLSSGDAHDAVQRFAHALGIDAPRARQSPEDKLAAVRALQERGRVVAMVGDGINDAPVLAGADVSIAIAHGSALARQAADLVLTAPSLARIADAVTLARRARRIVTQNLAWAIGYNLVALPLAIAGLVTPWIAALGMALSSLTVTLNALRVARAR